METAKKYDIELILSKLIEKKMVVFDDDLGKEDHIDFPILQIDKLNGEISLSGGLSMKRTNYGFSLNKLYYNPTDGYVHWSMGTHGGHIAYGGVATEEEAINMYNKKNSRYLLSKLTIID